MNSHAKDVARSHGLSDTVNKRINLNSKKIHDDQIADKIKKQKTGNLSSAAAAGDKAEKSSSANPGLRRQATKVGTNKSKNFN